VRTLAAALLAAGLTQAHADVAQVTLHGVDHILKQDDSRTGAHYGDPLLFSTQLQAALTAFTAGHLIG